MMLTKLLRFDIRTNTSNPTNPATKENISIPLPEKCDTICSEKLYTNIDAVIVDKIVSIKLEKEAFTLSFIIRRYTFAKLPKNAMKTIVIISNAPSSLIRSSRPINITPLQACCHNK